MEASKLTVNLRLPKPMRTERRYCGVMMLLIDGIAKTFHGWPATGTSPSSGATVTSPGLFAKIWCRAAREADQPTESIGESIFVRRDRRREEPARHVSGLVGTEQPKGRSPV